MACIKMRKKLYGNMLIAWGSWNILWAFLWMFGFEVFVKTAIPMAMSNLPVNETNDIWIEVPMPIAIKATLTGASASTSEIEGRTLGSGEVNFAVEMSGWNGNTTGLLAMLFVQEDAGLDGIVRYMIVISSELRNYAKYYCWTIAAIAFKIALVVGFIMWRKKKAQKSTPAPPKYLY